MPVMDRTLDPIGGSRINVAKTTITTAQVLANFATPITLVPSPGLGRAIIFEAASIHKPAGTAYTIPGGTSDFSFKYTNAAGLEVAVCETTGFADQATAQSRWVRLRTAAQTAGTASDITPTANAALVFHTLVAVLTVGTSSLVVRVYYRIAVLAP